MNLPPEEMRRKVLKEYVGDDAVTLFNREIIIFLFVLLKPAKPMQISVWCFILFFLIL